MKIHIDHMPLKHAIKIKIIMTEPTDKNKFVLWLTDKFKFPKKRPDKQNEVIAKTKENRNDVMKTIQIKIRRDQ